MVETVIAIFLKFLWPIALAIAAFVGLFAWGRKKQADGRDLARREAAEARIDAAEDAADIRAKTAAKPVTTKRKETERWEQ